MCMDFRSQHPGIAWSHGRHRKKAGHRSWRIPGRVHLDTVSSNVWYEGDHRHTCLWVSLHDVLYKIFVLRELFRELQEGMASADGSFRASREGKGIWVYYGFLLSASSDTHVNERLHYPRCSRIPRMHRGDIYLYYIKRFSQCCLAQVLSLL